MRNRRLRYVERHFDGPLGIDLEKLLPGGNLHERVHRSLRDKPGEGGGEGGEPKIALGQIELGDGVFRVALRRLPGCDCLVEGGLAHPAFLVKRLLPDVFEFLFFQRRPGLAQLRFRRLHVELVRLFVQNGKNLTFGHPISKIYLDHLDVARDLEAQGRGIRRLDDAGVFSCLAGG